MLLFNNCCGTTSLLHTIIGIKLSKIGRGFTVILNVLGTPSQTLSFNVNLGLTDISEDKGDVPIFIALNFEMFPVPDAFNKPINCDEFVHSYCVATPEKIVAGTVFVSQTVTSFIGFTIGVGITLIL